MSFAEQKLEGTQSTLETSPQAGAKSVSETTLPNEPEPEKQGATKSTHQNDQHDPKPCELEDRPSKRAKELELNTEGRPKKPRWKEYLEKTPDFMQLAVADDRLSRFLILKKDGSSSVDFKNPNALRALTYSLLHAYFDLKLELPDNRLCPAVTLRANYLVWIEGLIRQSRDNVSGIVGIDIGTGSSCIFPLMGHKMYGWEFIGTDIDELSLKYAQKNVELNGLQQYISIRESPHGCILIPTLTEADRFDFTMCNPPFFSNEEEKIENDRNCTASANELITEGGELQFVQQIIHESKNWTDRPIHFTSMIGRKANLGKIINVIKKDHELKFIESTEFVQGSTLRWAVCWMTHHSAPH